MQRRPRGIDNQEDLGTFKPQYMFHRKTWGHLKPDTCPTGSPGDIENLLHTPPEAWNITAQNTDEQSEERSYVWG